MSASIHVMIRRLPHAVALGTPLPAYQSEHAAGMDVHAAIAEPVTVPPGGIVRIPSGFALAVPEGYEAQIRPRSGLASKYGITLPNTPGTIDADYRGEIQIALINLGHKPFTLEPNMRIAQMIIVPLPHVTWQEVDALPDTARGAGGFGHTGFAAAKRPGSFA
jgi:dUTP pyrophosphatase